MPSLLDSSALTPRLLMVMLLAVAFCLSAVCGAYFGMRAGKVEVPAVIGKSQIEAAKELSDHGLRIQVTSYAGDDNNQTDSVTDQTPSAGNVIKIGQIVRVGIGHRGQAQSQK